MKNRYDVIIIGAGSVGVPSAYFLSKMGEKVLVIDELSSSGQGQNKSAIGGVRATHSDPAKIQLCLDSLKIFSNWMDETDTNIGWKKGGYCFPVFREKEEEILKSILPIQKKYGLNIDWVDLEKIKELIPGVNNINLIGGTYSPGDGQVSPLLSSESFTNEAVNLGAEFLYRESVIDIIKEKDKNNDIVTGVKTQNNTFKADAILHSPPLLPGRNRVRYIVLRAAQRSILFLLSAFQSLFSGHQLLVCIFQSRHFELEYQMPVHLSSRYL